MSTLTLFDDLPPSVDKGYRATVVRSHTRRLPGDPEATALPASTPAKQTKAPAPRTKSSTPRTKAPVPHNGTSTSREGAAMVEATERVRTVGKVSQYERIRLLLMGHNQRGLTRQEIADKSDIKLSAVCGRVSQLIHDGVCIETGLTRMGSEGVHNKIVQVGERREGVVCSLCPDCHNEALSLESRLYHIEGHGYLSVRICTKCGRKEVG